jgi:hypothetical protein
MSNSTANLQTYYAFRCVNAGLCTYALAYPVNCCISLKKVGVAVLFLYKQLKSMKILPYLCINCLVNYIHICT